MTTVLDLLGLLTLVAAAVVVVAPFTDAGAIAVAGVGLLTVSWIADRKVPR